MNVTPRVIQDNRATPCAVGLILAARRMAELPPGSVMEIWSRDRFAPVEIPIWAERDGHEVADLGPGGRWPRRYFRYEVVKAGPPWRSPDGAASDPSPPPPPGRP